MSDALLRTASAPKRNGWWSNGTSRTAPHRERGRRNSVRTSQARGRDIEGETHARREGARRPDALAGARAGRRQPGVQADHRDGVAGAGGRARQRLAAVRQRRGHRVHRSLRAVAGAPQLRHAHPRRRRAALLRGAAARARHPAHDARTDKRTSEFRKGYLVPLGITSMLDAPVFLRGKMVGVVCHEHTGRPRRWQLHEELLASSFADFVALVLETAAWHEAEDALRVERDALETKVAERTRDLQESESNLRALVDFSPVAMVLTRIADSKVLLANRRAAAMFEVPLQGDPGTRRAPALGEPGRAQPLPGARLPPRARRRLRGRDALVQRADVLGAPVGAAAALRRRRRAAGGDRRRHRAAAGAARACASRRRTIR